MSKSPIEYLETRIPNVKAKIRTIEKAGSDRITLRGYAVDCDYIRCDGCREHEHTFHRGEKDLKLAKSQLAERIAAEVKQVKMKAVKKAHLEKNVGIYSAAVKELEDMGMIDDLKNPNWANSTWRGALMYFKRQVLPKLDIYGEDICGEDLKDIESELIMKGVRHGRSRNDIRLTKVSVSSYLYRADQILDALYARYPHLPKVKFNAKILKIPSPEQAKYIPDKVRVRLAMLLPSLVANGETMGVGMMLYHNTRTAESCAPLIGEMILTEDWYVSYYVAHQIQKGERCPILKTDAGYRYTISGKMMYTLITLRIEHLLSQGYTMDEIPQMPLVSKPDNPMEFADPSQLAAYAKKLLLLCGYEREALESAAVLMKTEPDLGMDGTPEISVAAYVLRRDWVTRAFHLCGMKIVDIDYLVGHRNKATKDTDYVACKEQRNLAKQIERYVFDPMCTMHPLYNPIVVTDDVLDIGDFNGYRFAAGDKAVRVVFKLATRESGGTIQFKTTGILEEDSLQREKTRKDNPDLRTNRSIQQLPQDYDYYESCRKEALEIYNKEFKKKDG